MNIAGIDFSTHFIDVVLVPLDEGPPVWHRYQLEGQDAFERTRSVPNVVPWRAASFWDDVLAVGIEHPAGRHGVGPLLRIQGAVLACLPSRMLVEPWPPAKWRKECGLKGNASKEQVSVVSQMRLLDTPPSTYTSEYRRSIFGWPQDAHDAHLIALATRQALHRERREAA